MMPSNPGTIPEPVESEKLFRKKTLSNGSKTTSQTEGSVLENSRQQKAEEKRDYFHYQTNNATEEQINHIQDEHGTNSLKSSIALSSSKLKLRSRELPHLLGPTNQDLFSSAQVNQQHEFMDHQNHRLEELTEEMNSFHSEFRPLTHHHTRKLPLPRQTLTNPDLTDFIPDKSKSTSASNAAMMNESQARRVEHHTVERLQSNVNSAIPVEDIVDTVMPLEGNQARLKLFDAPPWMKRSTHTGVSPTGRRTPGAHCNAGTSSSMGTRGTTAAERDHASRASTSASGLATFNFRQVEMAPHTKPHSKRLSASEPPKVSLIRENEITSNRNMSSSPSPRRTTGEGLPKYPVQIVRTTKHDDDQLIEIIRERGAESKTSISSKLKPHRSLGSLNVRPRIRSATPGESYSHHQETNHIIAVNSPKYDEMTAPPPSSTYWRQQAFSESGGSPMLERGEYRSSLRNARVIRPIHSTPASPVMDHSANRTGMSASTMVRSHMWNGETRAAALPPPAQRNWSTQMTNSVRSGPTLVDNLTPTGPPVERVTTRIDPVTGMLQRVTSRTQSFSDITKNVYMTETDENIENDEATEYHIKRHTIRKHRPTTPREARSATRVERTVEPIHQSQAFHSKSMDEDVAQWSGRYSHSVDARPYRAVSQTNISGRQPMARNQWISESNLRTTTTYKQPPMYSTYSAHRENMRKMEELRRNNEDWTSNRQLEESKSAAGTEVLEEMETITLQPIGRGVHDLEPTGSIARSYRANTPTASLAFTPGPDQSDGYRTIATTNLHREVHTSGVPSPYAGTHHNTFYEGTNRGMDARYRVVTNQSETQWRGTDSLNAAYPGSFAHAGSISGVSGHGDLVDSEQGLLRQVKETFMDWYLPEKTREEVNALLRDKEPGSFIIRNSISYVNSFSIGLKIPQNSPHVPTRPDDIKSGFVRHFIIGTVPMHDGRGDGLQLCGFVNQPVFPSLVAFVHHHILQPGPFPCPLRLPGSIGQSNIVPVQQARMNYAPTGSQISGVAGSTGLASASAGAAGAGGDGIAADMLYLGQVEVDRLESAAAARRAVTQILTQASQGVAALPKRCEVFIKAIPHDGITFVDKTKRTMLRKHVKPSQLLWCGIDPENRTFTDPELRARGLPSARLFCIVARRQHFFMHENVVYVFSELEPSQSAINLCHYINGVFHSH